MRKGIIVEARAAPSYPKEINAPIMPWYGYSALSFDENDVESTIPAMMRLSR